MERLYKVVNLQDDTYQVVQVVGDWDTMTEIEEIEYQGSLADCEAYIRLKESGHM